MKFWLTILSLQVEAAEWTGEKPIKAQEYTADVRNRFSRTTAIDDLQFPAVPRTPIQKPDRLTQSMIEPRSNQQEQRDYGEQPRLQQEQTRGQGDKPQFQQEKPHINRNEMAMVPVMTGSTTPYRSTSHIRIQHPSLSQTLYQATHNTISGLSDYVLPLAMSALRLGSSNTSTEPKEKRVEEPAIKITDQVYPTRGTIPRGNQLNEASERLIMEAIFDQYPICDLLKHKKYFELVNTPPFRIQGLPHNQIEVHPHPIPNFLIHPE